MIIIIIMNQSQLTACLAFISLNRSKSVSSDLCKIQTQLLTISVHIILYPLFCTSILTKKPAVSFHSCEFYPYVNIQGLQHLISCHSVIVYTVGTDDISDTKTADYLPRIRDRLQVPHGTLKTAIPIIHGSS